MPRKVLFFVTALMTLHLSFLAMASGPVEWPTVDWPTTDWTSASASNSLVDAAALARLDDYAFARQDDSNGQLVGIRTDALLIVKHGLIQVERYYTDSRPGYGFDRDSKHFLWSASKAVVNALVGIAIEEGKLSLDTPINPYFPALNHPHTSLLRVRDALEMSSCLDWTESYETPAGASFLASLDDPLRSSVIAMLYGPAHFDMASFTASQGFACQPGSRWLYSSGDSNLLMGVLKQVYGPDYDDLPWTRLFDRIGMSGATFERDDSGTFIGSSYVYATARDAAKLGYLYLHDGVWNGARILPAGWVSYSAEPVAAYGFTAVENQATDWVGGPQLWSNALVAVKGFPSTWPAAPADMFVASGHWGQDIFMIPSQDTVIVRFADDRDSTFDINHFLSLALKTVGGGV